MFGRQNRRFSAGRVAWRPSPPRTTSPSVPFGPGTAILLPMTVSIGTYLEAVWKTKQKILCWKALLEAVVSGDNNLSLFPAWTRNCNTAFNDSLYRNLLGRCLGDKIEDPLLERLAGGVSSVVTTFSSPPFGPGTAILLPMTVSMGTYLGGFWKTK